MGGAPSPPHDWSASELGPPQNWPPSLKTAVGMALSSKFPKCVVWGPDLITLYNDAFRPILGDKPLALGRSFRDVWSEAWHEIGPIAERAYAGEATFIEDFPLVIDRYGYPEQCYFTFCYSPIRDENGVVRGIMDTVIETTGKVEAERQARLLNGELEHRIKNALTVIQAIVNQTFQSAGSGEEAREALMQRIGALAEAQALLTRASMAEAGIRDVIEHALTPFRTGSGRFRIEGAPVALSAKQSLSLALFEYRRGNYATAVDWSQRCLAYPGPNAPRNVTAQIILALAYHQMGRAAEARDEWLAGREVVEARFRTGIDNGTPVQGFWFDWLFARILLREARAVFEP